MKRVIFSIVATVVGLVALLSFKSHSGPLAAVGGLPSAVSGSGARAAVSPSATAGRGSPSTTSAPPNPSSSNPSSSNPPTSSSAASVKHSYTGSAIQTRYGVVQVAVTVSGSHIDSVRFVRLDAFDPRSQQINSQVAPILLQETVSAQSAHIDTVSGATYTSDGYLQSLQSALDAAGLK